MWRPWKREKKGCRTIVPAAMQNQIEEALFSDN
jgi:hypothetical protein